VEPQHPLCDGHPKDASRWLVRLRPPCIVRPLSCPPSRTPRPLTHALTHAHPRTHAHTPTHSCTCTHGWWRGAVVAWLRVCVMTSWWSGDVMVAG
jgi:hypothetical protein